MAHCKKSYNQLLTVGCHSGGVTVGVSQWVCHTLLLMHLLEETQIVLLSVSDP